MVVAHPVAPSMSGSCRRTTRSPCGWCRPPRRRTPARRWVVEGERSRRGGAPQAHRRGVGEDPRCSARGPGRCRRGPSSASRSGARSGRHLRRGEARQGRRTLCGQAEDGQGRTVMAAWTYNVHSTAVVSGSDSVDPSGLAAGRASRRSTGQQRLTRRGANTAVNDRLPHPCSSTTTGRRAAPPSASLSRSGDEVMTSPKTSRRPPARPVAPLRPPGLRRPPARGGRPPRRARRRFAPRPSSW